MTINKSQDPHDWSSGDHIIVGLPPNQWTCGPLPHIAYVNYYGDLRIDVDQTPGPYFYDYFDDTCFSLIGIYRLAPLLVDRRI